MDFNKIIYDLVELNVGEIFENEPMYKHTTFKVGGPAKIFVKIKSIEAIQKAKKYCKEKFCQN